MAKEAFQMSKQWIKVKELSVELGVTSHAIIQRCRDEGHTVQNSVTRLRPDIERAARGWFAADEGARQKPDGES